MRRLLYLFVIAALPALAQEKPVTNPAWTQLEKWTSDERVDGDSLYRLLSSWNSYPAVQNGKVYAFNLQLDTNYTVPYFVYIPKGYDPSRETALLVYYKGGWLSRDSLPAGYRDEIRADNPTYAYLDKYNVIEIFPALEKKLAIYGYYGYEHLRRMIADTKSLFNIDDNRVYLSGFSDGGKTVYLAANLVPSAFACFYPINGSIVSPPFYANYISRPVYAFVAQKDQLTDYRSILSKAVYANSLGANWYCRLLPGRHFYHPYQQDVLPLLFLHLQNVTRNPFPVSITYHRSFDYEEFTGIDWLQMQVNTSKAPEPFHFTDSVHTYAGDGEAMTIGYGEKTGQVKASYFNNSFIIQASQVKEVEIRLSPVMVNMNEDISIVINGQQVYSGKPGYSKQYLLDQFRNSFDRQQLWVNRIRLAVP